MVDRVVPGAAVVPEGERADLPVEAHGVLGPGRTRRALGLPPLREPERGFSGAAKMGLELTAPA